MGTTIKLTSADGFEIGAYRADPAGTPKGGIVVVQEIFGVNNHIRGDTDKFARHGYAAIAPAFFDRIEPGVELAYDEAGIEAGRGYVGKLDIDKVLADVQAAAKVLEAVGKVGVVGYCWGGTIAWLSATRLGLPSVGYYGGHIAKAVEEKPKAPVMLHFGEADHAIPLDDVEKIKKAHPDVPIHVYPGAGHGFNCNERGSYDAKSAEIALGRTLEFFGTHVG
jgi:carboxymethylenebutenolidase